ncbi:MAG TPA: PQQ-binding-like beta-propeller repeat protein [Solirubrobacteraceae bacterium]|nr:PQQ-binding-like beta-propeller repeat protein [Solirubrobacteraceae bacterium]
MFRAGSRRTRRLLAALAVLVVVVAALAAFVLLHKPGNVSHPGLSFTAPVTTTAPPPPPSKKAKPVTFLWPIYGYDNSRTRVFTGQSNLHPPFRVGWRFGGNALIEFPPVIEGHVMYFIDDGATAKAVNTTTGKQIWLTHLGKLSAASPAIARRQRLIIVPVLSDHGSSPGGGSVAALSMQTGHVVWSRSLPPGSESSPLVSGHSVYFGDQAGTVFALNVSNGHIEWTFHASGSVKGGLALSGGLLYFGDYSGRVYALRALNGHQVWSASTSGSQFGFGSGNFYATPAVAFGRVYIGNTDGFVYSFAAGSGRLAWSHSTGAYVYASAAVADVPGLGPTVYVGSYSGDFYAFNAQSGAVRWAHPSGGRISGSSTVINDVVYYSVLGSRRTIGLNARSGQVVYSYRDGAFTPMIADPGHLYLSGYDKIYQLIPVDRLRPAPPNPKATHTATGHPAKSRHKRQR